MARTQNTSLVQIYCRAFSSGLLQIYCRVCSAATAAAAAAAAAVSGCRVSSVTVGEPERLSFKGGHEMMVQRTRIVKCTMQ